MSDVDLPYHVMTDWPNNCDSLIGVFFLAYIYMSLMTKTVTDNNIVYMLKFYALTVVLV